VWRTLVRARLQALEGVIEARFRAGCREDVGLALAEQQLQSGSGSVTWFRAFAVV
jgi:hypothetical protein